MSIDPKLLEEIIREELKVVLVERIKKVEGGYKVFSKRGNRPLSKNAKSKKAALRQMAAIEISKAKRKKMEEQASPITTTLTPVQQQTKEFIEMLSKNKSVMTELSKIDTKEELNDFLINIINLITSSNKASLNQAEINLAIKELHSQVTSIKAP